MIEFFKKTPQLIALGCVLGVLFYLSYSFTKGKKEVVTEIKYVEKVVEKKVYLKDKSRTETTITRPDGTVERTIINNDITSKEESKESSKEFNSKVVDNKRNYSIGGQLVKELGRDFLKNTNFTYEVTGGYRLLGDIWLDGGYNIQNKDVKAGLSIKF